MALLRGSLSYQLQLELTVYPQFEVLWPTRDCILT